MATKNIFLYVPNIIGYVRLVLLAISFWFLRTTPLSFLSFYCFSIILDGFDGYAARKLNQVSTFGAWLDVAIDNLSRGMLYAHVFKFGWLISSIEWMVFVCTHTLGKAWKGSSKSSPPVWVQAVMANGFKTPIGAFAILGLHGLPIWFYIERVKLLDETLSPCMQAYVTLCLSAGRLLCFAVESWFIYAHIEDMVASDVEEEQDTKFKEQRAIRIERVLKREVIAKPRSRSAPRRVPLRHVGSTMIEEQRERRSDSSSPVRRRRRIRVSPNRNRRPNDDSPTQVRERSRSPNDQESRQNSQIGQNEVEIEKNKGEISRDMTMIREVPSVGGGIENSNLIQNGSEETLIDPSEN
ncbi:uncharacterized protein LOC116290484 [Actinia tenebrosa]|uniref:Uncharacterized protein LOC116290484 n=1 Tax=Actinia tenebrosa TaxID=6105 RepID=A0A6P8HL94_ACTTE|nr:uncharacterized protein LOC116290484 [Actinia tenebrosa]